MAGRSFLPLADAALLQWAQAFSSQISATPTVFGLVAAQATAFAALVTAYQSALNASTNESTRTKGTIAAKNTAKANLNTSAGNLARIINGTPTVTDQQKLDLRLTVRSKPTPIPPPSSAPALEIGTVRGWIVNFRLHDSASAKKRGKPPGVIGASVFSYVGATPPGDISAWKFEGSTGRSKNVAQFASTLAAGTTVWLTAFWFNGRKASGPACNPVNTNLQGGSVSMAA